MAKNTPAKGSQKGTKKRSKSGQSPMMEQFWRAKKEQPEALLFFRMGDFYELFGEDAVVASRELGITLTSRAKGTPDALPMAGVPVRSVEGYLMRLVDKGFRVAICEQLTDPKESKGIVERGIVRVVTPGTLTEEDALDARRHNDLAALWVDKHGAGLAWVDVSTGRFRVSELSPEGAADEVARVGPAELLFPGGLAEKRAELTAELEALLGRRLVAREDWRFARDTGTRALQKHFQVKTLEGYGLEDDSPAIPAAGALVEYLAETQKTACEHIRRIERVEPAAHVVLDRATRSCLELVATQREGRREGTLLDAIDGTLTPMGGRMMREWLLAPLRDVEAIRTRQAGVAELVDEPFKREELRALLDDVLDVERLVAKVSTGRANGRDLLALARSLALVGPMREQVEGAYSEVLGELHEALDPLDDLTQSVLQTVVEQPPPTIKEGGLIRDGVNAELDELRTIAGDAKSWMARFQAEESERSEIPGLKIGYNSVFGYFLEVPRGQVERVPDSWVRKQTIKTAERYVTPELKEFETKVLHAEERARELEYRLFGELRDAVADAIPSVLDTAHAIARLDVLCGLAQKAAENRYARPEIDEGDELVIDKGRHPVIELSHACEAFVPNDSRLDLEAHTITILTGPNMAGKSTYIRQTALIVLLAQIGSFVPAASAKVGVVDRVFTRVGAGDDISRGASTFMVEMVEIANILNNAGRRSLVILDEVGRGTSTFDGLALAWAIVEHLREKIGARTLFATHYHQLTELANAHANVCNKSVAVREWGEEIVFLHEIIEGGTDRSYGIHVARLAGVPPELLERAREVLRGLEDDAEDLAPRVLASAESAPADPAAPNQQLSLFAGAPSAVERELEKLELESMTPLQALNELARLRAMLP